MADEERSATRERKRVPRGVRPVSEALGVVLVFVVALVLANLVVSFMLPWFGVDLSERGWLRAALIAIPAMVVTCAWVAFIAAQPGKRR